MMLRFGVANPFVVVAAAAPAVLVVTFLLGSTWHDEGQ
jgi:hypothetical protein